LPLPARMNQLGVLAAMFRLSGVTAIYSFHAYPVVTHSHNMWGVANLPSRVLRKSVR
jgi:hypothetical protein